jgi:hypothetical protein
MKLEINSMFIVILFLTSRQYSVLYIIYVANTRDRNRIELHVGLKRKRFFHFREKRK